MNLSPPTPPVKVRAGRMFPSADHVIEGSSSIASAFGNILGFKGGGGSIANPGSFGRGYGGSIANQSLVATVRGTDLAFVLQQGQNKIGR